MEHFSRYIDIAARLVEGLGVLVILAGIVFAFARFALERGKPGPKEAYERLRRKIGMTILLGLEILVAADIIATVVADPSIDRVLALGLIVLIRTFLSLSIQVELDGKLPWQGRREG
jgi:uncharacterized membrane protein